MTYAFLALAALPALAPAQTITYSGSLRVRQEVWDWFKPEGSFQNAYSFTGAILRYGATRATKTDVATIELAAPLLLGLPQRASAPAPAGGLGLGALYRTFNGSQNGGFFVKQAFYQDRVRGIRAGRFEFNEGTETTPAEAPLAWLKSQRVAQRLIGTFGWTHVGRSFDGAHYSKTRGADNLTGVLAYPTRGVFDLDGQDTLTSVRFGYVAGTRSRKNADDRLFGILYEDERKGVNKVDNRTASVANADKDPIRIVTLGGHHIETRGPLDLLAWAALQSGDWGQLRHEAHAYALEAGWRMPDSKCGLWLRAGYNVFSGDGNGGDRRHKTFYPLLNTPRLYARTPFFAEANSRDLFVQAMARPDAKTTVRLDLHRVALDNAQDRWYAAGGPFESSGNFGLIGRANPSGATSLADLVDLGVDRTIDKRTSASLYLGCLLGRSVVKGIYPDRNGLFGYGEVSYKF